MKFTLITILVLSITGLIVANGESDRQIEDMYEELGIPRMRTVDAAVSFVTNEAQFLSYKGGTDGSNRFPVSMPSGKVIDSWYVNNVFSIVFRNFDKESIPALIQLLEHDAFYIRYGAFVVLQQKTGRYDKRCNYEQGEIPLERQNVANIAWNKWWENNRDNPRLDVPPERVYEASEWEKK